MSSISDNKRVAKNTLLLYVRMLVLMLISFFTARVTLNALGVEDYGINNVVGGLVSLFSLFTNSMTAATSRFITFTLGENDEVKLNRVFSTSINLHIILALIIIVLLEAGGVWFLNHKMVIPAEKMFAANWVFQFSIIGFAVSLISIPYNACIVAHERMSAFAYMTILDGVFKLVIAFSIFYFDGNRLILYSLLGLVFTAINRLLYYFYCKHHFKECTYHKVWDTSLNKEIFSFSGWNFIGAGSGVLRDQGVNVLLNLFCGPIVNAAQGIAMQIRSVVTQFAQNFTTALNPQITKSFAAGERRQTFQMVFQGSRVSYFLLMFLGLPIILETDFVLVTWLKIVPDYTAIFVRLMLVYTLIESLSFTMVTLMLATGKIRNYQIIVGGCQLLNFPLAYLFLRLGVEPQVTIIISIVIATACMLLRFVMLRRMVDFPVWDFVKSVLGRVFAVSAVSLPLPWLILWLMEEGWTRLLLCVSASAFSAGMSIYYIGLTSQERNQLVQVVKNKFSNANRQK